MTAHGERRVIPATAEALFRLHPGITVARDRIGMIDVVPTVGAPTHLLGFDTLLRMARVRHQAPGSGLAVVSRLSSGGSDTKLVIPIFGTVEDAEVEKEGTTNPAHVVEMARAGIELLDGWHRLSDNEKRSWPSIPSANQKVYDWMEFPDPDIKGGTVESIPEEQRLFAAFAVARRIFLTEVNG